MKKIIPILFFLIFLSVSAQETVDLKMSELKYEVSKDTTSLKVFANGKLLNGKYKIIDDKFPTRFSLTEFIDGEADGKSESIHDGILVGTKYFKNGLPNGEWTVYDNTGKTIMWKIPLVNGKSHGIAWYGDEGEKYYLNDKEVSKEEYEKYIEKQ